MNVRYVAAFALLALATAAQAQLAPLPAPSNSVNPSTPAIKADDNKTLTGETPLNSTVVPDPTDIAATSSPLDAQRRGLYLPAGTPLTIRLAQPASSASLKNGELVTGTLLNTVRTHAGTVYPQGTPVKITIVSAAPAGKIQSAGVLSVQVDRVGTTGVITNVLEFTGQEGHKEIPDAAPAKGTEAMIQPGTTLNFKVLGPGDTPAPDRPNDNGATSGSGNQQPAGASQQSGNGAPQPSSGAASPAPGATTPH